jgi:hypothetical protein
MTTFAWPTLTRKNPAQFDWSLASNTQTFASPLNGSIQTVEMPGARWKVAFTLDHLDAADSALLRAFLVKLRGQANRFTLHNLARPYPRGTGGGTPVVSGAGQTGASLTTSGWTISSTVLRAGDYFAVNGELKLVIADVTSNGSGVATVTFEPPLRGSPANGAALTVRAATATFMVDDNAVRWVTTPPLLDAVSIAATEVWT